MMDQDDADRLADDISRKYPYPLAATYWRAFYDAANADVRPAQLAGQPRRRTDLVPRQEHEQHADECRGVEREQVTHVPRD